jgi:hypothetical protein
MSSPEDSDFVKDSFAEIPEIEICKLDADERVKKLISAPDTQTGTIEYGGVEIRFKLFLSKSMRHRMLKSQHVIEKSTDEQSLTSSETIMYEILGSLCTEEPWNHWETWAYVDEKSENVGGVQSIFIQVLARIAQSADDVKNFRKVK